MHSLFGWNHLNSDFLNRINNLDKSIILFPHTSKWDIFNVLTYLIDYPSLHGRCWIVIRKSRINRWANSVIFFKYFHMIEAPTLEELKHRGTQDPETPHEVSGLIDKIANKLKHQSNYLLFLSPEGDTDPKPWKSGYYTLAKKLQIPITVIGFDYIKHSMVNTICIKPDWESFNNSSIGSVKIEYDQNDQQVIKVETINLKDEIQLLAQDAMSEIVPLYREKSYVPIKNKKGIPTPISENCKISVIIGLTLIIIIILMIMVRISISCTRNKKR